MELDKDDNKTFGQQVSASMQRLPDRWLAVLVTPAVATIVVWQVRDNCIRDIEMATTSESSNGSGKKRPFFM